MTDVLAIVGSTLFADDPAATEKAESVIWEALFSHRPDLVISGGAKGLDQIAVRKAQQAGIETREFLPKQRQWAPHGYKERNMQIALACTRLLVIRHHASKTYGSGWTADRAEEMGKPVRRVTL